MRTAFVELKPRFPLFGGWQTEFTFGYSLPLHSIVSRLADGRLRLKTDFSTPFESMVVDDLTVKVRGHVPGLIAPCVAPGGGSLAQCSKASARGSLAWQEAMCWPSAGQPEPSAFCRTLQGQPPAQTLLSRGCHQDGYASQQNLGLHGAKLAAGCQPHGDLAPASPSASCSAGGTTCRQLQHDVNAPVASSHLLACIRSCLMVPSASRQASR